MVNFIGLEELYASGAKLKDIADHFGVGLSYLRKEISRRGLPPRRGKNKPDSKAGRPPKLTPALVKLARNLSLLGLNDEEIYTTLEISKATFYEWKRSNSKFSDAIGEGRDPADGKIARALYKRALGGTRVTEEKAMVVDGKIQIVKVRKTLAADVRAAETWLSRRQPKRWGKVDTLNLNDRTLRTEIPEQPPVNDDDDFEKLVDEQISNE